MASQVIAAQSATVSFCSRSTSATERAERACHFLSVPSNSKRLRESTLLGARFKPQNVALSNCTDGPVVTRATATAAPPAAAPRYALPSWAHFEMGHYPVFWETATGRAPASGERLTIWFNPSATSLTPNADFGIGFNGGFNSPFMCAGEPRIMTKLERGPRCSPFYTININMPVHAKYIEFSFTDGGEWEGPYTLDLEIPAKWRNLPASFFDEGIRRELDAEGACETAIYPDAPYVQDRCLMPGGMGIPEGKHCALDLVPGCTDPESPFFDPLANVDDGSCPLDVSP